MGISPSLLTSRLAALIDSNVVRKITLPSPVNAQLYELTEIGREIQPAIRELIRWGGHFLFPPVPGRHVRTGLGAARSRRHRKTYAGAGSSLASWSAMEANRRPSQLPAVRAGTTIQKGETPCKGSLEAPFDAVLQIIGSEHIPRRGGGIETRESATARQRSFASCRNYSTWPNAGVGQQQQGDRKTRWHGLNHRSH